MDLPPSNNPNHPSNQLHDAAYPMSDYQPQNITPLKVRQPYKVSQRKQQLSTDAPDSSLSSREAVNGKPPI
ncbi:unnamed protein product [Parascedosporium putredinis]|uniref:Uncharacterized protein n=1 Tax=Parascedosporium putredinis TaxID=1442378 RepID=A0A9P1H9Z4_9PEZI|nr:unnamed protein product [Parascedosporium putredinis]CAI8001337.1 unnamed protein product [Parascedosporium putredinis]